MASPLAERFWSKVDKGETCWLWSGALDHFGYGVIASGLERERLAHRVAWRLTYGAIPKGLRVLHHCDTPRCCNPSHLFVGTQADNVADCVAKGRAWWQRRTQALSGAA